MYDGQDNWNRLRKTWFPHYNGYHKNTTDINCIVRGEILTGLRMWFSANAAMSLVTFTCLQTSVHVYTGEGLCSKDPCAIEVHRKRVPWTQAVPCIFLYACVHWTDCAKRDPVKWESTGIRPLKQSSSPTEWRTMHKGTLHGDGHRNKDPLSKAHHPSVRTVVMPFESCRCCRPIASAILDKCCEACHICCGIPCLVTTSTVNMSGQSSYLI